MSQAAWGSRSERFGDPAEAQLLTEARSDPQSQIEIAGDDEPSR
jgi:hypothetical protein